MQEDKESNKIFKNQTDFKKLFQTFEVESLKTETRARPSDPYQMDSDSGASKVRKSCDSARGSTKPIA